MRYAATAIGALTASDARRRRQARPRRVVSHDVRVMAESRVSAARRLPPAFKVFVNGVLQRKGARLSSLEDELLFARDLAKEGRLGLSRWLRRVGHRHLPQGRQGRRRWDDGRPQIAHELDIVRSRPTGRVAAAVYAGTASRHGAISRSALRIARVAGRAVERVEVDARRAVGEQVGALQRRVGDAEVGHRARLVAAQLELAQQRRAGSSRRTSP